MQTNKKSTQKIVGAISRVQFPECCHSVYSKKMIALSGKGFNSETKNLFNNFSERTDHYDRQYNEGKPSLYA